MSWTTTNPVAIGDPTKKAHYDALWNNVDYLMSPYAAQGSIAYATGANALAQLAKGSAYALPRMNSTATAPEWGTPGQIIFPAAQNASAGANTLDDYEEGTWTPCLYIGGELVADMTYNTQVGLYTKIGRMVTAAGSIILTEKGSASGIATVSGLPFAAATLNYPVAVYLQTVTFANQFQGILAAGATAINLQQVTEAGNLSNLTDTNFADTSRIYVCVVYQVA
jgi:hypothetical protein